MKRFLRKMSALLVAMAMIMAMCMTVSAEGVAPSSADKATIKVTNVEDGATVTAYQIVAPEYNSNGLCGYKCVSPYVISDTVNFIPTPDEITTIAGQVSGNGISLTGNKANGYTASVGAGEYIVIITSTNYIYNPMESVEIKNCNINSKQIVSVGRLTYQKGFDILCDVAKDVLSKNPDYKWIIKGKVSNVEDYYENSALYVMTSRFEGLPMTLLEAKNHKLPIVSFDCPTGPSEIIRNNVNGYLVKANDVREMSNKINTILQDDKKLKEFKSKANLDIEKFNLNSIIDKWTSLLVSI